MSDGRDKRVREAALVALGWYVDREPVPRIPLLFAKTPYREHPPIARAVLAIP